MKQHTRLGFIASFAVALTLWAPALAFAHEGQVIRFGSFLGGFTHPVLGLDHFLAMVSVGIVSSMIGGRAIWIVPGVFVTMMAIAGLVGRADIGLGSTFIETGIALSVIFLGFVILADRKLGFQVALVTVVFFGFFHGYAHGVEIPNVARPVIYALGFLFGTAMIHIAGVLIGEVAKRYRAGRQVLRFAGGVFLLVGVLFIAGVL